jgi:hypothetical protein
MRAKTVEERAQIDAENAQKKAEEERVKKEKAEVAAAAKRHRAKGPPQRP